MSKVTGIKQTARNIRRMASVAAPINAASRFALIPMLKDAKANLGTYKANRYEPGPNIVTGDLQKSMAIRLVKKSRAMTQNAVTATGKGIKKAHLVEFGTDPHWQPKRKVMHPGAQPFPFLTPAYHKNDVEAVKRFGASIGEALRQQASRMSKKR